MPGGAGTNDDSTNQRVFLLASGNMAIQYGQTIYNNLAAAVSAIPNESYVANQGIVDSGVLIGVITCRKDATNASLVASCVFSKVSRFDSSGVSAGSNSVATLQSAYDNSVTPQITTSTLLGSVDVKRGSAADTDNVFRLQNGAGSDVVKANGNGRVDTRYSSPNNMLNNGDVEFTDISMFTCTVGTCIRTTSAGEYSSGNAALKVALSAQAMNVSQTITTPSGIQKQGVVGFIYRIPATGIVTPTVTVTVDSVLQVTVPTDKLIMDGLFHSLEVPILFGATDIKISFLSGSSTGSVFFDGVYVKQGIGFQNLQLDNVYSALVNAGVISNQNKAFLASCTNASPSVCVFTTNFFTVAPNCVATTYVGDADISIRSVSSTGITLWTGLSGTSTVTNPFILSCQKSGNDYLAASAQVYSQASANYSRRAYTPTFTGFGTVSSVECYESRDGEFNDIDCSWVTGSPTGVEARVSLPANLTSSALGAIRNVGNIIGTNSAAFTIPSALIEPSTSYVTFGQTSSSVSAMVKRNGNDFAPVSGAMSMKVRVPIAGWSNSAQIVGSFENVPTVPNAGKRIDIFSVNFGGATISTNCTGTPCTLYNQIGTAVSFNTRSATGNYTAVFSKTYAIMNCQIQGFSTTSNNGSSAGEFSCTNCSSLNYVMRRNDSAANIDSYGSLMCQGTF